MKKNILMIFIHFLLLCTSAYSMQRDNQKLKPKNLNRRLLKASSESDNEIEITQLISCGADVNYLDTKSGETPLIAAVRSGKDKNVKILLNNKARPSRPGYFFEQETSFNMTSVYGGIHERTVKTPYLTNPLIEAAKRNKGKSMLLLAQKGGRPFKINEDWKCNFTCEYVSWHPRDLHYAPINYLVQSNNLQNTKKLLSFAIDRDRFLHRSKNFHEYYEKVSSVLCYKKYLTAIEQPCFYTKSSLFSSRTKDYSYKDYLTKSLTFLLFVRKNHNYIKWIDKRLFLNYIILPAIQGTFPVLSEAITVGSRSLGEDQKKMHSIFNYYESKYSDLFPENSFIKIKREIDKNQSSCVIS